jgi:hypothetical protein
MVISDDPNYITVLKKIAKHLLENQVESLLMGRDEVIKFWTTNLLEVHPNTGSKSIQIFTNDVDVILDKVYGVEFV